MQWTDGTNAGFNRFRKPWLPISTNYKCVNVKTQLAQKRSHLNNYKRLIQLRKQYELRNATFDSELMGDVYTYKR